MNSNGESDVIAFHSWKRDGKLRIYLVDITGGDVNPTRGICGDSNYQPDWYHPVGWSVSPAANFVHYLG